MVEPLSKSPRAFISAVSANWFSLMSGGLSVPLSIAALLIEGKSTQIGMAVLAITCFVLASYTVWRKERETIHDLGSKIDSLEDVLYCINTTLQMNFNVHAGKTKPTEISVGFNINVSKPVAYEVVVMKAQLNNINLPSHDLPMIKSLLVIPSDKKWFLLPPQRFPPKTKNWTGDIEYKILFGPPSDTKRYFLAKKVQISADMNGCQETIVYEERGKNEGLH